MHTGDSRILTTHAGSLPRPRELTELHSRRSRGAEVDPDLLRRNINEATAACIAAQVEAGIDIGSGGEQARESFAGYVRHRMTGFGGTGRRPVMRDLLEHPDYLELIRSARDQDRVNLMAAPAAIAAVKGVSDGSRPMRFVIQVVPGKAEGSPRTGPYLDFPTTQPGAAWARIARPWIRPTRPHTGTPPRWPPNATWWPGRRSRRPS